MLMNHKKSRIVFSWWKFMEKILRWWTTLVAIFHQALDLRLSSRPSNYSFSNLLLFSPFSQFIFSPGLTVWPLGVFNFIPHVHLPVIFLKIWPCFLWSNTIWIRSDTVTKSEQFALLDSQPQASFQAVSNKRFVSCSIGDDQRNPKEMGKTDHKQGSTWQRTRTRSATTRLSSWSSRLTLPSGISGLCRTSIPSAYKSMAFTYGEPTNPKQQLETILEW